MSPHLPRLVSALLLASSLAAQPEWFSGKLTGDQEVPPVRTSATGWGIVTLNPRNLQVSIFVEATGLNGTAAHLHQAAAGVNGPVIVPLRGGPTRWRGSATLTAAQAGALRQGGTYLNVHTRANPGGEIRGQALAASATRFVAALDGSQEVPPNNSPGTGQAVAFLHEPDNVLVYRMSISGVANVVAAHIHIAPRGQNGPVIVPLRTSPSRYCGVSPRLTSAQVAALKRDGLYFNVHSSQFPAGEIRGQILSQGGATAYFGHLSGANEVPPVRSTATGNTCVELTADGRLRYVVTASGLSGVAAHIHRAPRGQNGGIVFPLQGGPTVWSGTTPVLTPAQLADLRNGLYYVNVHTRANPGGEIRDQLQAATRPFPFGGACRGSNGFPEIGADGIACLGTSLLVTLSGARAGTAAALLLGTSRDTIANIPLPIPLGLASPDCFLLIDFLAFPVLAVPTDSLGCAQLAVALPLLFGLRGQRIHAEWVVLEPRLNSLNIATSNGLTIPIH